MLTTLPKGHDPPEFRALTGHDPVPRFLMSDGDFVFTPGSTVCVRDAR